MGGGPGSEAPWKLSYLAARARWHRAPSEEKTAWCITTRQPSPETCLEQDYSLSRASHFSWSRGYRALYNLCYRKAGRDLNARLEEPLHKPQPDQLWFPRSFSSLLETAGSTSAEKRTLETWNGIWVNHISSDHKFYRQLGKPLKFWHENGPFSELRYLSTDLYGAPTNTNGRTTLIRSTQMFLC